MSWLKKARGLKRISAKALAEECGLSMNYIQKIEGGNRDLPHSTASLIFDALGFSPQDIAFDTKTLLDRLETIEGEEKLFLTYRVVDDVVYFTDLVSEPTVPSIEVTVDSARLLLKSQDTLFG